MVALAWEPSSLWIWSALCEIFDILIPLGFTASRWQVGFEIRSPSVASAVSQQQSARI